MLKFLKKYWYIIVILLLLGYIVLVPKTQVRVVKKYDNMEVIKDLKETIDILKIRNNKLYLSIKEHNIDTVINTNYEKIYIHDNIIPTYVDYDRDMLWSRLTSEEDSISRRYWHILDEKTGGRSLEEISVEGFHKR